MKPLCSSRGIQLNFMAHYDDLYFDSISCAKEIGCLGRASPGLGPAWPGLASAGLGRACPGSAPNRVGTGTERIRFGPGPRPGRDGLGLKGFLTLWNGLDGFLKPYASGAIGHRQRS
jgi:hypothetical protein